MKTAKQIVFDLSFVAPEFHDERLLMYLEDFEADAREQGRREGLKEALKIARGTKEDGYALAKKAHAEGDAAQSRHWAGESEGAAEIERDIMNLLGIDWANGETEAIDAALSPRGENEDR